MIYILVLLLLLITLILYLQYNNIESFNTDYVIEKNPKTIDKSKYILKSKIPVCPKTINKSKYILKSKLYKYLSKVPQCPINFKLKNNNSEECPTASNISINTYSYL